MTLELAEIKKWYLPIGVLVGKGIPSYLQSHPQEGSPEQAERLLPPMRLTLSLETLAANPYRRQILRTNHPFQFSWSEIQCFGFDSTKT